MEVLYKMIYEFTGQYKVKEGVLYLFNKKFNCEYKIIGEDSNIFLDTLPFLTGTFTLEETCKHSDVDKINVLKVIEQLKRLDLIKIYENSKLNFLNI